jgi:CRISPR-associated protein Csd2
MSTRKLIVFKHESNMGSAPAHKLFDMVQAQSISQPVRDFSQYSITVPAQSAMPQGVTVIEKL